MSFNTVGELIEVLQRFDRSTPILKMCGAKFYFDVDIFANLLFRVQETERGGKYIDCAHGDPNGFDAVVL